ncbi:hypothetical protein P8C59_002921 [Phyllachora maydis]|uniref:DUF3835 domain-containing protein n=1 Tax=Phyllachora maydis TaxID=1825666 RepID=A0AAD9HZ60_9PEZI|nr:hypothetical protein P8C59_002921 [Phyllachora maydis]
MQDAFAESLLEATQRGAAERPKLRTGDANSRREELLNQAQDDPAPGALWRQRPGQIHIDEVDEFLETTLEDIGLATKDIGDRIDLLKLPMDNMDTFEHMLEDRSFRLQILDGNQKIEHIVSRTLIGLAQSFQDVKEGLQSTREFTLYLNEQQNGQWCQDRPDVIDIYKAMRGNTDGWYNAFLDLQTKGNALKALIGKLNRMVADIERLAGEVSRRTRDSIQPDTTSPDLSPTPQLGPTLLLPTPHSDLQYFRPVQASPHSPLQQRPHSSHTSRNMHMQLNTRNLPSAMGMSTLSSVTTMTNDTGTSAGVKTLKKKRSAFGWLKKAFSLDENERAVFEAKKREQAPNLHIQTLEEKVATLRASLSHWQQWYLDYAALKEEIENLPANHDEKRKLLARIRRDFEGDVLTRKELNELMGKHDLKEPATIVNLLARRIDYVDQNVATLDKLLRAEEERLAAATIVANPDGGTDEETGLPITDIIEELDEDGNVVNSRLQRGHEAAPKILDALKQAGVEDASSIVERQVNVEAKEPDGMDDALMYQAAAAEYNRLRNRMIQKQGGFVKPDESPYAPLDEEDGGPKRVSRFKAARLARQ